MSNYGCDYVFEKKVSGATTDGPELLRMLENLREGDVIVVTELARITRSTQDLFN
ncbi:DNA invertase Pin-like site-specific DNA recombinase [Bacillus sp. RC55]